MSSNGSSLVTKTVTANNSTLTIPLGFQPKKVVITNATSLARIEWDKSLLNGYAWKQVAAGTRTLLTSGGPTPTAWSGTTPPGFSIGAVTDINDTTTEVLHIEAWRE